MVKTMEYGYRSKRVQTLFALLRSLSDKYLGKGMNAPNLPAMG